MFLFPRLDGALLVLATQPNTEAAENVDELVEEFFSLDPRQLIRETPFALFKPFPFSFSPFPLHRHPDGVELSVSEIRQAVQSALAEDIGSGDATTLATVPEAATARAAMRAREPLVVAGLAFAEAAFAELSPAVKIERLARDGQPLKTGDVCCAFPARRARF